ncbi:MAG: zinc-binding dehydrogenase [Spirochaetaceae bacterium]
MKAVVTTGNGGYEKLEYKDVPIPVPDEGEVLHCVLAAGVNKTEINTRVGRYSCTAWDEPVFANLIGYIERHEIKPLLARSYPLSRIAEAQRDLLKKAHVGKFVLVPEEDGHESNDL